MAKRKRTDFQREADLPKMALLYRDGHTQRAIAQQFGLSQGQICQDLAEIRRRWQMESIEFFTDKVNAELSRIDNLEITYWEAWERSILDATMVRVEKKTVGLKVEVDNLVELPAVETKEIKSRTGQSGNPAFLAGVMSCIERRCKLLGLDAPAKAELTGKDGGAIKTEANRPDLSKLSLDELLQLRSMVAKATDEPANIG